MCYSSNASLISFVTCIVSSTILYNYNKIIALFFIFISFMQLFDYIFWNNNDKNMINFITTKIAMIFNAMQPVVLAVLIMFFMKQELKTISKILMLFYIICVSIYIIINWNKVDYTLVTYMSKPSLDWKWNHMPGFEFIWGLYLITFIILLFENFKSPLNYILIILLVGSFIMSIPYLKKYSLGRFWCYFAGYLPLVIVLIYQYLK